MQIGNMPTTPARARQYGGHTGEARREARREKLIEAAIRVYGEAGCRNASVKAVCSAAGLTERYFYESFAGSEALLIAAFETRARRLIDRLNEIRRAHAGTADERGRAVLQDFYQTFKDDPVGARLFVIEVARFGPSVDRIAEALLREFGEFLTLSLAPDPNAPRRSCELARAGAVGAVLQILKTWIHTGYEASVDAVAAEALNYCRVLAA
jgi:AcrR family transcriptional regulator